MVTVRLGVRTAGFYLWPHHLQDFDDAPFWSPEFQVPQVHVLDSCLRSFRACDPQQESPISQNMQEGPLAMQGSRVMWQSPVHQLL